MPCNIDSPLFDRFVEFHQICVATWELCWNAKPSVCIDKKVTRNICQAKEMDGSSFWGLIMHDKCKTVQRERERERERENHMHQGAGKWGCAACCKHASLLLLVIANCQCQWSQLVWMKLLSGIKMDNDHDGHAQEGLHCCWSLTRDCSGWFSGSKDSTMRPHFS